MPRIHRRSFLKAAAATSAISAFPQILRSQATPALKQVNIACVGAGGQAGADRARVVEAGGVNIVALCDVDERRLGDAAKGFPKARTYTDYRKMLEEVKDVDGVIVGTPDHHHFPASMLALKQGKAVYCEKPLTHSVWEARTLAETARAAKITATQMGTQGHGGEGIRLLTEWIAAGVIGTVKEVHIWTDRPAGWWPQGVPRPSDTPACPRELNWDLWLGPAPERPYHPAYHPFKWRGWWDFGTGALGDIGCHAFDLPFTALGLTAPTRIEATSVGGNADCGPLFSDIVYAFPTSNQKSPVKLSWYDGRNDKTELKAPEYVSIQKLAELAEYPKDRRFPTNGQLYIGDKGKLMMGANAPRLVPESKMKDFEKPQQTLPRSIGHYKEWVEAIRGGPRPGANFDYAGPVTEAVLAGNLAVRLGKAVEWDAASMKATNAPEAAAIIRREYRKGWV